MPKEIKHKEDLIKLAKAKGNSDADLVLLDLFHALQEKVEKMGEDHKRMMQDAMAGVPGLTEAIAALKAIAEKEIPVPVVNVPETKIEVKAPSVNVMPPSITVEAPQVTVPPPIVNVNAETKKVEIDESFREEVENLREEIEGLKKSHQSLKEQRPVIFGPGKTRVVLVDLSSQLDGVKKKFFLGTHFGIISVQGSSAPFGAWREGTDKDYYEVDRDIQFTDNVDASISLAAGQSLIVKYLR